MFMTFEYFFFFFFFLIFFHNSVNIHERMNVRTISGEVRVLGVGLRTNVDESTAGFPSEGFRRVMVLEFVPCQNVVLS